MKKVMVFITAILFLMPFSSLAATINVPGDQPNIQAGIDAAVDGDTVLIADGTYTGTGNYNINFNGKAITVKSANGPENCIIDCQRQGRGFVFQNDETETSVLDGLTIRNGYMAGSPYNNGGGVYAVDGSPTINNCIFSENREFGKGGAVYSTSTSYFTNCTFSGNSASGSGGAVYSTSTSYFTNCTFSDNMASSEYDHIVHPDGGAVYSTSTSYFTNCTFSDNSAYHSGGAVYSAFPSFDNCIFSGNSASGGGAVCSDAFPSFDNCTFSGNSASGSGGAVLSTAVISSFTNCTFSGNSASSGGAVVLSSPVYPGKDFNFSFTNCAFSDNITSGSGGAIYCYYTYYDSSKYFSSFTNCTFSGNSASDNGGAVFYYYFYSQYPPYSSDPRYSSSSSFDNCTFSGNSASDNGGAVYSFSRSPTHGPDYYSAPSFSLSFNNCIFSGNSASYDGGAVYSYSYFFRYSQPCGHCFVSFNCYSSSFTNCTFSDNSASYVGGAAAVLSAFSSFTNCTFALNESITYGGAIYCGILFESEDQVSVKNCIFWDNVAPEGAQIYEKEKPLLITYSDIQGNHLGAGNISLDPMFIDAVNGDLHLQPNSPCIDAGISDGAPVTDFDGNSRPAGSAYDMGAYECQIASLCRVDNLPGCTVQTECEGAGGYWYDNVCNANPSVPVIEGIPVPTNQSAWNYASMVNPIKKTNPSDCKPFAVGDLSSGNLSLQVGLPAFSQGVDVYLAIQSNVLGDGALFLIDQDYNFQIASTILPRWKTNNSTAIYESLYGDISTSLLPSGLYNLYIAVTPTGETDFSHYYFWSTSFNINH